MVYNSEIRNGIIKVMAKYGNLRAKKIYTLLNIDVSYQAVFKMIKLMVKDEILIKDGLDYKLNKSYVDDMIKFVEDLKFNEKEKYATICKTIVDKKETVTLNFSRQIDLIKFIFGILDYCSAIDPNDYCIFHISTLYGIFSLPREIAQNISNVSKNTKMYMIARQDTNWNEIVADFFRKLGIHVKSGINFGGKDVIVYKNSVMKIIVHEKDNDELCEIARKIYSDTNINVTDFLYDLYEKEIDFTLEISYDPKFASQLKDKILDEF